MKLLFKKMASIVLISVLLFLAACSEQSGTMDTTTTPATGSSTETTATEPKTMSIGIVNPPAIFNPINTGAAPEIQSSKVMFDTLLEMSAPLEFVPKLAESFETTDNQTYTIKIHPDANWSDGVPITAEDVAFTFNLIANPKVSTSLGGYISTFEGLESNGKLPEGQTEIPSVTIIDEKTLEFKTQVPVDPNYIKELVGMNIMTLPKHMLEDVPPEELSQHEFFQAPSVTSGPFKFVEYLRNQHIEYEKNPDYYLGEVKLDSLFIKTLPSANMTVQFQTGDLDMNIPGTGDIPMADRPLVEGMDHLRTVNYPSAGIQTMMFNLETFPDPKVRQAITYAVDRQLIVDNLLQGNGQIVDTGYALNHPYFNTDIPTYTYDPEKAKQLLAESGWDMNQTINLVVPIGNQVREQSANIITQNLQDIGLKIEVTTFDFPTIMQKGRDGAYDLLLFGVPVSLDPDRSTVYAPDGMYNYMRYYNDRSEELINAGKVEVDQGKRIEIYHELQRIWSEDMPVLTLYLPNDYGIINNRVINAEPKEYGLFLNVHEWDVE